MSERDPIDALNLSPMKTKFVRAYMRTGNATEAALIACKCKNRKSAASRGHQLLKELNLSIKQLAAIAGLTNLKIVRALEQGIEAHQIHLFPNKATGEIIEYKVPDWSARARFLDIAIKALGGYPKPQMELPFEFKDGKAVVVAEFASNVTEEAA